MSQHFLTDLLVLELGHRLAVSACGSVLSELGCEVVSVLGPGRQQSDDLRAGKRSLQWQPPLAGTANETLLLQLIARADVPMGAVITEYVDVAHAFYDKREAGFVNGLLDAIGKGVRGA